MGKLGETFKYSVGRKWIMALTGLFLVIFLLTHVAGNLLLFVGEDAYIAYAEGMKSNPLITIAEVVLFLGFLFHIVDALVITKKNSQARPQGYYKNNASANSSWFSRNMGITGTTIFVFLVLHLISFFMRYRIPGMEKTGIWLNLTGNETIYDVVELEFAQLWYVLLYVAAMVFLAFHLVHGFQAAFMTLGVRNKTYTPILKGIGIGFAIIVPALFAAMPIFFYIKSLG